MNLPLFILKRINKGNKGSFSSTVSSIAVISISLGLAVIIISFSVLEGFKRKIQEKIFSLGGHLQVTMADNNKSFEEMPFSIHTDLYKDWKKIKGIKHLQVYSHKAGLLQTKEEVIGVIMKGVGKDFDIDQMKSNLVEGEFISVKDTSPARQVIISRKISDKMKLKLGDSVLMYFVQNPPRYRKLHIKGIYETGLEEFDEQVIIGDIRMIQRLNNLPDSMIGGYEIFIKDFEKLDEVYQQVYDDMDYYLGVEKITEKYPQVFEWLQLLDRNVIIFLVLILWVASFNMVSSVFIMIMERTSMIGILKAMGASNNQVQSIFFFNGLMIIFKGLLFGNLIGMTICYLQYQFKLFPLDPENYYMDSVPIYWNWNTIFALNLLTVLVISLVLIIPVIIISYVRPVKSIRFN